MPKITIIMPSLNVIKYICPCMDSILRQTMQDLEILVIDAGSTDGTTEILRHYVLMDERIHLLHSDHKSYGYQVNLGLEQASGEYIGIVETDDMIAENMYKVLYQTAKTDALEYVKCGYTSFFELDSGLRWDQPGGMCIGNRSLLKKVVSPQNMPELAIQDYYLWAGIYRRDFLKNIRLSETSGAAFQDIGFIYQVLSTADRAMYLEDSLYFYRQTKGNSSYNKNGFQYLLREYTNIEMLLLQKSEVWRQACYERMFRQIVGRFQKMAVGGEYWEDITDTLQKLQDKLRKAQSVGVFKPEKMSKENQAVYDKFMNDPEEVFEDECAAIAPKKKWLYALLENVGDREAIIFGCGSYGKYIHVLLETYKPGQICAFCDNNKLLWNTVIQGLGVKDPGQAVREYPDAQYIIASKKVESMREQLYRLGIGISQIVAFDFEYDLKLFML